MGKKVSDQMAATAWDDASPIFSIFLELFLLKRINLIADKAGNRHCCPPGVGKYGGIVRGPVRGHRQHSDQRKELAAVDRRGCVIHQISFYGSAIDTSLNVK